MWVAATAHFCGHDDCQREGQYEVRLEQGESVWATRLERDEMLTALEGWQGGIEPDDEHFEPIREPAGTVPILCSAAEQNGTVPFAQTVLG